MCPVTFAALVGLASAGCVSDGPSRLLAPTDPSIRSGWSAPRSPTGGLQSFTPADPKDWLQLNKDVTPKDDQGGMSGMSMPGMGGGK